MEEYDEIYGHFTLLTEMNKLDLDFSPSYIGWFSTEETDTDPISLNEDRLFSFKGYIVYLYANEGPIPHIHLKSNGNPDVCVRLDKPEYFNHNNYTSGTLNSKEKKIFNKMMAEKEEVFGTSRWEYAVMTWNYQNPKYPIKNIHIQPNYTKL